MIVTCFNISARNSIKSVLIIFLLVLTTSVKLVAQDIEGLEVETYYISDASDATDTIGGGLEAGSVTYRVFLDLAPGCSLRTIYGDEYHRLLVASTEVLWNNLDRGELFAFDMNVSRLDENTVPLDSWFGFAAGSKGHYGVLKTDDTDGSIIGGANNDGGSAEIPVGLLINDSVDIGIPLTNADGLIPGVDLAPPNFIVVGDPLDSAFGTLSVDTSYISNDIVMRAPSGVVGPNSDNKLLLMQITTKGEISFELNLEILKDDGSIVKYVAVGDTLLPDETISGFLSWPPECGCMDPDYLEFDPAATCDDGSCQTLIVFGCLDTIACNFDPLANFHVQELCCYAPDSCNGLDISIVCPGVGIEELNLQDELQVFPNPVRDNVELVSLSSTAQKVDLYLMSTLGKTIYVRRDQLLVDRISIPMSELPNAVYSLIVEGDGDRAVFLLVKN